MKKKKLIAIIAIVLGFLMAGSLVGIQLISTSKQETVVVSQTNIKKGEQLSDKNLKTVKIYKNDIKENYCQTLDEVKGKYACVDIVGEDIITNSKISNNADATDNQFLSIPSGKQAISFSVDGGADSLSNKLEAGDIIRIYSYKDGEVKVYKNLQFVRIASITSSNYKDVDQKSKDSSDDEISSYSSITVIVNTEQVEDIIEIENNKGAYVTLISRGNEELAQKLLSQQDDIISNSDNETSEN